MLPYEFDPANGKYIGNHEAQLDTWQTDIKGSPSYIGEANCVWTEPPAQAGFTAYMENGEWVLKQDPTLVELKTAKHNDAGAVFAQKRDAVRQVQLSDGNTYGFDCANEDITNFMASWKAAEGSGSTPYKVWKTDGGKGMITMQLADFTTVFNAVRTSQLEAYAWYSNIDAQIQAATTAEEVEAITL